MSRLALCYAYVYLILIGLIHMTVTHLFMHVPIWSFEISDTGEEDTTAEVLSLVESSHIVTKEEGCEEGEEAGDGGAEGHPVVIDDVCYEVTDGVGLDAVHIYLLLLTIN